MIPSIEEIKTNYKNMADHKLMGLAISSASSLRPEALEALKDELKARGLDENLDKAVDIQMTDVAKEELDPLISRIRALSCPYCGSKATLLNAVEIMSIKSYVLMTETKRAIIVGCPDCLLKESDKAWKTSALLGWWGIPWGIIRTPIALIKGMKNGQKLKSTEPTDDLIAFVKKNRGVIMKFMDDDGRLEEMITSS